MKKYLVSGYYSNDEIESVINEFNSKLTISVKLSESLNEEPEGGSTVFELQEAVIISVHFFMINPNRLVLFESDQRI